MKDAIKLHKETWSVWEIQHFAELRQAKDPTRIEIGQDAVVQARAKEAAASVDLLVTQVWADQECFRLHIKNFEYHSNRTSARLIDLNETAYDNAYMFISSKFEKTLPVVVLNSESTSIGATNKHLRQEALKELGVSASKVLEVVFHNWTYVAAHKEAKVLQSARNLADLFSCNEQAACIMFYPNAGFHGTSEDEESVHKVSECLEKTLKEPALNLDSRLCTMGLDAASNWSPLRAGFHRFAFIIPNTRDDNGRHTSPWTKSALWNWRCPVV